MSLKRISARTIAELSIEETWQSLTGPFIIVFDDGHEQLTNHKEAIYSRYYWDFHSVHPGLPITPKHYVTTVLGKARISASTNTKLVNNILWDCVDYLSTITAPIEMDYVRSRLAELAYNLSNRHYNDAVVRLGRYVSSLSILDFHKIFNQRELVESYTRAKPDEESINDIYSTIDYLLKHKEDLKYEPLSKLFRSGLVSDKQVFQILGPRGRITDINNELFGIPIMRGFYQGIRSQREIQIESRSAAKALNASKGDLQDTEYFSRKLRTMDMGVERLHHTDCGSTRYFSWRVRGKREDAKSDLEILDGKHYMDENGKLQTVRKDSKHLIDKVLRLRSAIYCGHEDPNGICAVCYGMLSDSIPQGSNIGHANCTHVTEKNAQGVLSTKHLDSSKSVKGAVLDERQSRIIKLSTDGNRYLFSDIVKATTKNSEAYILFDCETAPNLGDIYNVENVQILQESRMSELPQIAIRYGANLEEEININDNKRLPFFTYEFLEHIKQVGYSVDEELGCYVVSLKGWKWTTPFASLPMRDFNMSDHSRDIAKVLESTVNEVVERDRLVDPASTLLELTMLMNRKATVNLAIVEVTLLGAMIRSAEHYDYALPKPWTQSGLGVMSNTILYRSIVAFFAYEHHTKGIYAVESYVLKNRPDHPLDGVVLPLEVQAARRRAREGAGNF